MKGGDGWGGGVLSHKHLCLTYHSIVKRVLAQIIWDKCYTKNVYIVYNYYLL